MSTPPSRVVSTPKVPPKMKRYQLIRFSFGKATSFAPIMRGMMKFPNTAGIDGIRKKKIMTMPCMEKATLYWSASMRSASGVASSRRIRLAKVPPIRKKKEIENR